MDRKTFLSSGQLVKLAGITQKQLELQLQRRGAELDAVPDSPSLPITPAEPGRHPRYSFTDALVMSCVGQLLRCGLGFGDALRLVKLARLDTFPNWPQQEQGDLWLAAWSESDAAPDAALRHVFGSFRNVSGALPSDRMATISLNISQVCRVLEAKLRALGIARRGAQLVQQESLL